MKSPRPLQLIHTASAQKVRRDENFIVLNQRAPAMPLIDAVFVQRKALSGFD
jgi:hypothetical protein